VQSARGHTVYNLGHANTLLAALICAALTVPGQAQNSSAGRELESILNFETEHKSTSPLGWGGGPTGTIFVDGEIVHDGRWSVRLERTPASPQMFSTLTKAVPVEFGGTTIEWRGFLRSENVSDFMGLWMRQDGDTPNLAFETMQPRQIRGTNDWTEYSITFPLHRDARQLYFGVLLGGTGKVWADDLRLLVDGKPVWDAPKVERPKTPLELDHQFDRRVWHRHQRAVDDADPEPDDAGQGLGLSQVPPSGGGLGDPPLGLRVVPRVARRPRGARS
jgi:hypothetical protein